MMNCSVCDGDIHEFAFGPCNHKEVCAKCMLRWILLFKETKCPVCRVRISTLIHKQDELTTIVITSNSNTVHDEIVHNPSTVYDQKLNAYFESNEMAELFHQRLGLRCPVCYSLYNKDKSCQNPLFKTPKDLIKHITLKHQLIMCDTCLDNLKVFPSEMQCYTNKVCSFHLLFIFQDFQKHLRDGINDPELDYRADPHAVIY